MMTYTVPITDSNGVVVGVIGADITIDSLANIAKGIKPYPNSFCTLVAGDGTTLAGPPMTSKKLGKSLLVPLQLQPYSLAALWLLPPQTLHRLALKQQRAMVCQPNSSA